jgi:hypothetical protein
MKNYAVDECSLTDEQMARLRDAYESGDFSEYIRAAKEQDTRNTLMGVSIAVSLVTSVVLVGWAIYQAFN